MPGRGARDGDRDGRGDYDYDYDYEDDRGPVLLVSVQPRAS